MLSPDPKDPIFAAMATIVTDPGAVCTTFSQGRICQDFLGGPAVKILPTLLVYFFKESDGTEQLTNNS